MLSNYFRHSTILSALFLFGVFFATHLSLAIADAPDALAKKIDPLDGPPVVTCDAWIVVDAKSGKRLDGWKDTERLHPASVTKMMTALLVNDVLKQDPDAINETITFSENADKTVGSTSDVNAGEKVSVGDLLYGLLLPSGNDASVAFAEHFGDRVGEESDAKGYDRFIEAMNQRAKSLGMDKTGYRNSHGLDHDEHLTTAADQAKLACEIMKSPILSKVVGTANYKTHVTKPDGSKREVEWDNTNRLLKYQNYLGIKTGTTSKAGACLASCCEREGDRRILIVLGSSGTDARYSDSRNLWRWTWTQTPPNSAKTDNKMTLSPEAKRIHESSLVIDGHNDLMWEVREKGDSSFEKIDIRKPQPKLHTDIPRLKAGNVGAQFWSVYVPATLDDDGTAFLTTLEQIALVKKMVELYPDQFELAMTVDDIERITKSGKLASLIGVEGGHCIQESLSNLNHLYDQGARYMTLTHSKNLSWADSSTDEEQTGGLSPFGVEVIQRMNRLGMMVDISHVSAKTMHAAMDVSKAPIIFSHSSARAVADSPRNVPDDVLKRVHDTEGLVMVNFYSAFVVPESAQRYSTRFALKQKLIDEVGLAEANVRMAKWDRENPMQLGTIEDVLDHIDHLVKVAGWEHVGLGADFDGVDALPEGLEDVSRYPYITQGLLDRGYTEEQIRGILGENLMRVMRKVEEVAAEMKQTTATP